MSPINDFLHFVVNAYYEHPYYIYALIASIMLLSLVCTIDEYRSKYNGKSKNDV